MPKPSVKLITPLRQKVYKMLRKLAYKAKEQQANKIKQDTSLEEAPRPSKRNER
jgi:hypothetical protein